MEKKKVLSVEDLVVKFNLRGKTLTAVRGTGVDVYKNETLAIVGESGSGKSVFTKALVGMTDKNGWIDSGHIYYEDQDLAGWSYKTSSSQELKKRNKKWLKIRGKKIAMVFQDPMTALNPLKKIGEQIREVILLHTDYRGDAAKKRALELMEKVGIPHVEIRYNQYPHEFSGGMRQRIVIAIAVACEPDILICDEPTTALDVTLQAQILDLLRSIQKDFGLTIIFITHDLGVVANIADRVAVMYAGKIIEVSDVDELFKIPVHPYTRALLKSLPQLGKKGEKLYAIKGTPPNLYENIKGDAFAPRNPEALKIDFEEEPPEFRVSENHYVKTWLMHEIAMKYYDSPAKEVNEVGDAAKVFAHTSLDDAQKAESTREVLLDVNNLCIDFGKGHKLFRAVDNASFQIHKGETLSLVGESGSGKTTIGRAIMKITPNSEGEIYFDSKKIDGKLSKTEMRDFRQNVQMIFQDPMASLNERAKVDYIVSEGLKNFNLMENENDRKEKVARTLNEVGLLPEFASRFPHEFSGGQRQRLGIARALIMNPKLIIADEPISALDVSIRAQIINLMNELKKKNNLTYLFIAHDLSVVRFISDRIAVIYKGKIVELAGSEELFRNPLHPYTRALLSAIPMPNPQYEREKKIVVYDPSIHNYTVDKPKWCSLKNGHYVLANEEELNEYSKMQR